VLSIASTKREDRIKIGLLRNGVAGVNQLAGALSNPRLCPMRSFSIQGGLNMRKKNEQFVPLLIEPTIPGQTDIRDTVALMGVKTGSLLGDA